MQDEYNQRSTSLLLQHKSTNCQHAAAAPTERRRSSGEYTDAYFINTVCNGIIQLTQQQQQQQQEELVD
jgi:hypothetical protein